MTGRLDPFRVPYGDSNLRRRLAARDLATQQMRELGVRWGEIRAWALGTGRWMPADVTPSGVNPAVVQAYYDAQTEAP